MFEKILQLLSISCSHKNTSKPFAAAVAAETAGNNDWELVGSGPSHYVVCLDCGKKFAYDWANMHLVR